MGPRRLVLWGLAAAVLLAALLVVLRGPLALLVVRRALERNLTQDAVAALPDGLHVVLCGAGGPLPDPERSGPCAAVVAGSSLFVVDAGSGGARNLARLGLPPGRIEAVLLTHFHSDHIDGLGELALQRWIGGPHRAPLPVLGPPGVEEVVAGFDRAYRQDAAYRTAHHGPEVAPPGGAGMEARAFELPGPGESVFVWGREALQIVGFRVQHDPARPAVGYRFDYGGRSVLISGDTKRSAELREQASGVDLLVHDALSPRLMGLVGEAAEAAGRGNVAAISRDVLDYHASPLEVAELAEAAGVRHLLYYHIVPPLPIPGLESVFLEGVGDAYGGGVTVGRDGTRVSLPRGSQRIEVSGP